MARMGGGDTADLGGGKGGRLDPTLTLSHKLNQSRQSQCQCQWAARPAEKRYSDAIDKERRVAEWRKRGRMQEG